MRVGAHAVAAEFGKDRSATPPRVCFLLEDEHRGSFAEREARAAAVERPANVRRERLQRIEARIRHLTVRIRATGERRVRPTVLDQVGGEPE